MRIYKIFFLLLALTFSFSALAKNHYVFLVHGVASHPAMFGSMKDALKRDLNLNDQTTNWIIRPFQYDTGNNEKTVIDFSRDLADFIKSELTHKGIHDSEASYSLIMHSQGGVIGMRMMIEMYKENFRYHPHLLSQLDAYISLGTPYWGAKAAVLASRLKPIFDYLKLPLHDQFGLLELRDMEIGSDYNSRVRHELLEVGNENFISNFKFNQRLLIISGVSENLNLLAPIVTGKYRFEDDMAVPVPMAHLDYYHFIENPNDIKNHIDSREFSKTEIVDRDDYMIINAIHVSPLPENKYLRDMMYIPKSCLSVNYKNCDHPAYTSIVDHLLDLPREPYFKRDLTSFGIDLKIIPPKNNKKLIKDIKLKYKSLSYGAKIGSTFELYSNVKRIDDEGNLRIFRTGDIDSKKATSTRAYFELQVLYNKSPIKTVKIPVETSVSSYVEIYLNEK